MSPYLKILRLPNLAIIILTQYLLRICIIGTYYGFSAASPAMGHFNFSLLVVATLLIAAGGYIINDIKDVEIDRVNKPDKLLISKIISVSRATRLYYFLSLAGVIIGFYLAYKANYILLGFIFIAVVLLLWFYSDKYQKTVLWGNLFVALLSAMVIVIVWIFEFFSLRNDPIIYAEVMQQLPVINILVFSYALFAFLVSLIRELIKDVEDIEGDKKAEYRTLPIQLGKRNTKRFITILILVVMTIIAVAQYLLYAKSLMLVFWYLMIVIQSLLLFLLFQVIKAGSKQEFHFLSNATKIIMIAGILSMQLFYISF